MKDPLTACEEDFKRFRENARSYVSNVLGCVLDELSDAVLKFGPKPEEEPGPGRVGRYSTGEFRASHYAAYGKGRKEPLHIAKYSIRDSVPPKTIMIANEAVHAVNVLELGWWGPGKGGYMTEPVWYMAGKWANKEKTKGMRTEPYRTYTKAENYMQNMGLKKALRESKKPYKILR